MKKRMMLLLTLLMIIAAACAQAASIRRGSTGSDVEELQKMLSKLGYYSGNITGHAGDKTIEAIEAFQERNGLKKDGIAGSATMNKIKSLIDPNYVPTTSSQANSSDVEKAQKMLKDMGIYSGQITGNIGSKTKAAIKAFQKKHGLEESGLPDAQTMAKLQSVYSGNSDSTPEASEQIPVQESTSADDVKKAQTMLKDMDLYYGEITGNVGTKTKAAIKKFQNKYGLTANGVLSAETLAKIQSVYGGSTADEEEEEPEDEITEEVIEAVFTSLRFGSTGTNVSILQENLTRLGYYYGDVTGNYGTKTRAAVRSFQKAEGLTADGIAGKKTFAAVQAEVDKLGLPEIEEDEEETGGEVLDLHWFNEKSFYNSHGVKKGATITVMDIVTGKMFNVRVQSTGYHADVEPKTAADTQIMCDVYGVDDADDIDWKRRAVLVKANMGGGVIYTYAASMYGEVHGEQTIYDNDYDGQFCIHFRHSTTSETKIEYADNQNPIDKAVNYAVSKMGMTHITDPDQM